MTLVSESILLTKSVRLSSSAEMIITVKNYHSCGWKSEKFTRTRSTIVDKLITNSARAFRTAIFFGFAYLFTVSVSVLQY